MLLSSLFSVKLKIHYKAGTRKQNITLFPDMVKDLILGQDFLAHTNILLTSKTAPVLITLMCQI